MENAMIVMDTLEKWERLLNMKNDFVFAEATFEASPSSLASNHASNASLAHPHISIVNRVCIVSSILFLICLVANIIPNPNSALSSNSEFAQDGPLPSWLVVYGVDGADPPHIEEHPVAFAIIILSPNN